MGNMADKVSGKAKQAIGRSTDNKELQAKGKAQETKGDVKGKLKNAGEKLTDKLDNRTK